VQAELENIVSNRVKPVCSQVDRWQQSLQVLSQMPLDRVQGEYTRLFITGYPTTPCPPYESAYRHGVLLGDVTEELVGTYRHFGLEVVADNPPDHLAVELEFMIYLSRLHSLLESPADQEAVEQAQQAFLKDHLRQWLPRFATDLVAHARLDFYRVLGEILLVI